MRGLVISFMAFAAQTAWTQNTPAVRKLCLCELRVHGTSKAGIAGGFVGGALGGAIAGASESGGYYAEFGGEVQQIFESALRESKLFQYIGKDKIATRNLGKDLPLAEAAKQNQLDWCMKVDTTSAAAMGFNKKLRMVAKWELVSPDGRKVKIETSADSVETYGKFPDGADPNLKTAYLELAKEIVGQFLDKLPSRLGL